MPKDNIVREALGIHDLPWYTSAALILTPVPLVPLTGAIEEEFLSWPYVLHTLDLRDDCSARARVLNINILIFLVV